MPACQSSLSPKVFGQTALQNCILPLLLPARVQTVQAPFCVQDLRAVAAQAIHNSPSSRAWHRGYSMLLPSSIVRLVLRSEEHTSELQSRFDLVCRLLLE